MNKQDYNELQRLSKMGMIRVRCDESGQRGATDNKGHVELVTDDTLMDVTPYTPEVTSTGLPTIPNRTATINSNGVRRYSCRKKQLESSFASPTFAPSACVISRAKTLCAKALTMEVATRRWACGGITCSEKRFGRCGTVSTLRAAMAGTKTLGFGFMNLNG